jgi:hypothetical protein
MNNNKLNFALIFIVLIIGIFAFALSQNNSSEKITDVCKVDLVTL